MTKKEKFLIAEYRNIKLKQRDAVKVRGFFADLDETDTLMHNHLKTGKNIYRYPRVQYKVLHHHPYIVAFGEGINSLYPKLMSAERVTLDGVTYDNPDLQISLETKLIGDSREIYRYKFLTPWLALNQENYRKFINIPPDREDMKEDMLKKILTGNILSLCGGFDVNIEGKIDVSVNVKNVPVRFKGEPMIGFIGSFEANVHIPGFCGIGKGVSRGMGTIVPIKRLSDELINSMEGEV